MSPVPCLQLTADSFVVTGDKRYYASGALEDMRVLDTFAVEHGADIAHPPPTIRTEGIFAFHCGAIRGRPAPFQFTRGPSTASSNETDGPALPYGLPPAR
jgi:hypothetical protein